MTLRACGPKWQRSTSTSARSRSTSCTKVKATTSGLRLKTWQEEDLGWKPEVQKFRDFLSVRMLSTTAGDFFYLWNVVADLPGCPRDLRVTEVWKDGVELSWREPEVDGGSGVTGYHIEKKDSKDSPFRY